MKKSNKVLSENEGIPPALSLLFSELAGITSVDEIRKKIVDLLPILSKQSEAYIVDRAGWVDGERSTSEFSVHLSGALDILLLKGCSDIECRINASKRIARSVGLVADEIWLTDLFSERFVDLDHTNDEVIYDIFSDVVSLLPLVPLMQEGIIKFKSPLKSTCESCIEVFNETLVKTSKEVVGLFDSEFDIVFEGDGICDVSVGRCLEPPIIIRRTAGGQEKYPGLVELRERWVYDEIRSAFWAAREASLTGGVVFSNSRVGLAGLLQQDMNILDINTLLLMDNERSFSVPWVSDLTASQIIELRQEAVGALPLFREKLARAMIIKNTDSLSSSEPNDLIGDLREQAAEVRVELKKIQKNSARYWKSLYAILGLGLSAYGVANEEVVAGVGGLLPIIQLMIAHSSGHKSEIEDIISRPGYVLVKAQDILKHEHG